MGGGTLVKHVVIREQKNAGKGTFFMHPRSLRGARLGLQFHAILEKRVYFSTVQVGV